MEVAATVKHTIEPVVSYAYVPVVDQSQLPIFDETDRIEPRSLFTYGVVSRFYGKFGGRGHRRSIQPRTPKKIPAVHHATGQLSIGAGIGRELAEFSLLHMYDTSHAPDPQWHAFFRYLRQSGCYPSTYASIGTKTDFNPNTRQFAGETVFLALRPPMGGTGAGSTTATGQSLHRRSISAGQLCVRRRTYLGAANQRPGLL